MTFPGINSVCVRRDRSALVAVVVAALACCARADLPDRAAEADVRRSGIVVDQFDAPLRGLVVTASADGRGRWTEPSSGRSFGYRVDVYLAGAGEMVRRFRIHAADASLAPFAVKTGRVLALLWALTDERAGRLAARLRSSVLDVWLCRDGEAGGEQSQTSLWVYDVVAERSGIEWLRTVSHEYGHYLLPGASGYREPEAWSNGLLGERMFIGWLRDGLAGAVLRPEDVPFASQGEIDDYWAKQVEPLIARIASRGPAATTMAGSGRDAMDELCALLLFVDRVHGARAIFDALVYMQPGAKQPRGLDFLHACQRMTEEAGAFTYRTFATGKSMIFVPKGAWLVGPAEVARAIENIERCGLRHEEGGRRIVSSAASGWQMMVHRAPVGASIRFERR